MSQTSEPRSATSSAATRIGWVLSAIVALFLLMDAAFKLIRLEVVLETTAQLGWPATSVFPLGVILLVATALYIYPRTSVLGAIVLTGYLGGAIATHFRISRPLFTHTLFGVYVGLLMWLGLILRNKALRGVLGSSC